MNKLSKKIKPSTGDLLNVSFTVTTVNTVNGISMGVQGVGTECGLFKI